MLSSPIILYDYPGIAPESVGDLCDATEIDEILMLRVMTLSDEEKREARGTDERSRQIIERSDTIPAELFGRLHGAIRSLGADAPAPIAERSAMERFLNGEEPAGPAEDASTEVDGVRLSRGSRVTLRPKRRADAMDMFMEGRTARVEAIHQDVDGATYVAVTVEDDPAADLHAEYGRYFYFYPDEVEPIRSPRILVAGIGNIFNMDDGFGVEVAHRLRDRTLPDGVKVEDFGIRGMHLAYEMRDGGYATTILVDASPRGQPPGTVYLIEPDLSAVAEPEPADAHAMHPGAVIQMLSRLGGVPGHLLVVGCEPEAIDEGIGLSGPVARAVDEAVEMIVELVARSPQLHSER
jgi:hydrogenase maturation protease